MKTLQLTVKNNIGILEKLSMVFTRNRVNLECLDLQPNLTTELSTVKIQFYGSDEIANRLLSQLLRIVEVKSGQHINN